MSYTVIFGKAGAQSATVVDSALDALRLARFHTENGDEITIGTEAGWILTLEELEEMAH